MSAHLGKCIFNRNFIVLLTGAQNRFLRKNQLHLAQKHATKPRSISE